MSNEPVYVPTIIEATTEELINELGARSTGLLVVMNEREKGHENSEDVDLGLWRRKITCTAGMGMADYARLRLYDQIIEMTNPKEE